MSDYVMVPVPENLVDDVDKFMRWGLGGTPPTDDEQVALNEYLPLFDIDGRQLLKLVSDATLASDTVTVQAAATDLDTTPREIMGLILEVNEYVHRVKGPMLVMVYRDPERPDEPMAERVINMTNDVAVAVSKALR